MSEHHIDPSIVKSFFHGSVQESWLFPFLSLSKEEQEDHELILKSIRAFYQQKVNSKQIDQESEIPLSVLQEMKRMGLFGMSIPQMYGGSGLSITSYTKIMEEMGNLDASLSALLGAHHSIGLKGLLLYGTEEQKQKYLPQLASGEMIAAFALTEPSSGSDASSLLTKAEKAADGQSYLLTGTKIWITNGGIADFFTVFARTGTTDSGKPQITAFLVERAHGVKSGPAEHKLGIRGSTTNALYFENVQVPKENILGEVGQGFKIALSILDYGRMGLAAITLGGSKKLIQLAVSHVNERKAFGKAIGEFDILRDKIANMVLRTFALESMVYLTASVMDRKQNDFSLESAICKIFGSETVWKVADEALQIAGGAGYMTEYPYERHFRDARISLIFEGTNEVLRSFIALSGLQHPSHQLQDLQKAVHAIWQSKEQIIDFFSEKLPFPWKKTGLERIHPSLAKAKTIFVKYQRRLLYWVAKSILKYKHALIENQFLQCRFAEIAISLYGILATVVRTTEMIQKQGQEATKQEITWTLLFAELTEKRLDTQFSLLSDNQDQKIREITSALYEKGQYPFSIG